MVDDNYRGEIVIDNMLPFISCPHYCRNDAEKIRWFAWHLGLIRRISPETKVEYIPEKACFRLIDKGDNIILNER